VPSSEVTGAVVIVGMTSDPATVDTDADVVVVTTTLP